MPNITVTGYVYHSDGSIASGERLIIKKLIKNDVLISNNPIIVRANENGYIQFTTLDESYLWLYSKDIVGYDEYEQGTPVYTTTASVQNLSTLASFTGLLPNAIPVITNSSNHDHDKYATTASLNNHVTDANIHFTTGSISAFWGSGSNAGLTGDVNQIAVFSSTSTATGYPAFTYDPSLEILESGTGNSIGSYVAKPWSSPIPASSNILFGYDNTVSATNSIALGKKSRVQADSSIVCGYGLTSALYSNMTNSIAMGYNSTLPWMYASIHLGSTNVLSGDINYTSIIGYNFTMDSNYSFWKSVVMGYNTSFGSGSYGEINASIIGAEYSTITPKYVLQSTIVGESLTISGFYYQSATINGYESVYISDNSVSYDYGVIAGIVSNGAYSNYRNYSASFDISTYSTLSGSNIVSIGSYNMIQSPYVHSWYYSGVRKNGVGVTYRSIKPIYIIGSGVTSNKDGIVSFGNGHNIDVSDVFVYGTTPLSGLTADTFNISASAGLQLLNDTRIYRSTTGATASNELVTKAYVDSLTGNSSNAGLTGVAGQIAVFSSTSEAIGVDRSEFPIYNNIGTNSISTKPINKATGIISIDNNSSTITGVGTFFTIDNPYIIAFSDDVGLTNIYYVDSIIDDEHLIIADLINYNVAYKVWPASNVEYYINEDIYCGNNNFVVGYENYSSGVDSIIIGTQNKSIGANSLIIGIANNVGGNSSTILGNGNNVNNGIAVGDNNNISYKSIGVGYSVDSNNKNYSITISTSDSQTIYAQDDYTINLYAQNDVRLLDNTNIISSTTAVTSDNQLITKAYLDSITANLGGGMNLKYITLTGSTTGDIHLSDATNWNINKANINYIRVDTSSSAWNMYLLQNDNGYAVNDAVIPALQIMNNGFQNQVLYLDHNYWDEDSSNEVHLYWNSLSGSITANIYVVGNELK